VQGPPLNKSEEAVFFKLRQKPLPILEPERKHANILVVQYHDQVTTHSTNVNKVYTYAGDLAKHLVTWRKIPSDPWVLEKVSGYHLEFIEGRYPVQSVLPNPPMTRKILTVHLG